MHRYRITVDGKDFTLDIRELGADQFRVRVDGRELDVTLTDDEELAPAIVSSGAAGFSPPVDRRPTEARRSADLTAPLPGLIVAVDVLPGARVRRGDALLTLEAMKMRNSIRAPRDGVVAEVLVAEGQSVGFGEVLLRFGETP
jgi:biotin carboxyl carrier protein